MLDTITQSRSGEHLDVSINGHDVPLLDIEWDIQRPQTADMGRHGYEYGEAENVEFIHSWYGSLKITRDMLVDMMSEPEVRKLEYQKYEEEIGA